MALATTAAGVATGGVRGSRRGRVHAQSRTAPDTGRDNARITSASRGRLRPLYRSGVGRRSNSRHPSRTPGTIAPSRFGLHPDNREFPILLRRGFLPILLLFGVRPGNATVWLASERLVA